MSAARKLEIVAPDPFALIRGIRRMRAAGFAVEVENGGLVVESTLELSEPQRAFIGFHKPALVALLEESKTAPPDIEILPTGEIIGGDVPAPGSRIDLKNRGNRLLQQARALRLAEAEKQEPPPEEPDIQSTSPAESQSDAATWDCQRGDIATRDNPRQPAEPPPEEPHPRAPKPAHAPSAKPKYREVFQ